MIAPSPDSLSLSGSLNLFKNIRVSLFHGIVRLTSLQTKTGSLLTQRTTKGVQCRQWGFRSYPACEVEGAVQTWSHPSKASSQSQSTLQGHFVVHVPVMQESLLFEQPRGFMPLF